MHEIATIHIFWSEIASDPQASYINCRAFGIHLISEVNQPRNKLYNYVILKVGIFKKNKPTRLAGTFKVQLESLFEQQ